MDGLIIKKKCGTDTTVVSYLYGTRWSDWWGESGDDPNITHWMPLPDLPEGEKG